jgi:hypothetical protein
MIARVQLCLGVLAGPFIAAERGVFVTILAVHNKAQQEFLVKLTEHTTYVAGPKQSVIISLLPLMCCHPYVPAGSLAKTSTSTCASRSS